MDLVALIGIVLIILAVAHVIPLLVGLVLGVLLIAVGGYPRIGRTRGL